MGSSKLSKADKHTAATNSHLIVRFYDPDVKARDPLNRTLQEILSWSDSKLESSHNYIQMLFPLPEGSIFNNEAPLVNLDVMQAFRARSELRQQLRISFERMLKFYGFKVSTKSETELKRDQDEKEAAELRAATTGANDPLLESAVDAAQQKVADTGHSTAATQAEAARSQTNTYTDAPIDADRSSTVESSFPPGAHRSVSVSKPLPYHIIRAPNWHTQFQNWAVSFDHNHLRITRILRCLRVLGLQKEYMAFFHALEGVFHDPDIKISPKSMNFWQLAVTRPLHWAPDDKKCKWLEGWEKEQENLKRVDEEKLRNERDGVTKTKSVTFNEDVDMPEVE